MPYVASATPPIHVLLNPFAWVFWGIDFALWVLIPPVIGPLKMLASLFRGKSGIRPTATATLSRGTASAAAQ